MAGDAGRLRSLGLLARTSWRADRSESEILSSNIANQHRQFAVAGHGGLFQKDLVQRARRLGLGHQFGRAHAGRRTVRDIIAFGQAGAQFTRQMLARRIAEIMAGGQPLDQGGADKAGDAADGTGRPEGSAAG